MHNVEKLVVLDGFTLNPGDLSWGGFKAYGELQVYDFTSDEERIPRVGTARHIFVNKVKIDEALLSACPQIEYIGELATGFDNIDIEACKRHNVTVTTVPGYGGQAVAQYAFGLLLELCHNNRNRIKDVRNDLWKVEIDYWQDWAGSVVALFGKTLGIIGFGDIGRYMAIMAKGFGMEVVYYSRSPKENAEGIARYVSLDELYQTSDVISLHTPLNKESYHLLDDEAFEKMKTGVIIINTARGALIDEKALVKALANKKVLGAGLDVVEVEPISLENPLLTFENCIITPHLAWGAKAARKRLIDIALNNYKTYLLGKATNQLV